MEMQWGFERGCLDIGRWSMMPEEKVEKVRLLRKELRGKQTEEKHLTAGVSS